MSTLPRQSTKSAAAALKNPRFHARLRKLIGGEAPYAWADRMGISKGAFTRIWKEGTVPTSELLYRIRAETGVSLDWLLTGEGAAAGRAPASGTLAYVAEFDPALGGRRKARGKSTAAGQMAFPRAWIEGELDADPAELTYVTVRGESMAPTLADGDLALVDRRATRLEREGVYALLQGANLRVRRVQRLSGDRYQALSDNARYQPFTFKVSPRLTVIGRVLWVGKRI